MAKKKTKDLTDYEKIYTEFQSDLNDKELQERYDGFKRTREAAKQRHNEIVPVINELINEGNKIKDIIVDLAIAELCTKEAAKKVIKIHSEVNELRDKIAKEQAIMNEEDFLIQRYEHNSEKKFFFYWKMFRALDSNTPSWLDWYHKQYKGQII
jgi:hypothetical protein